MMDDARVRDIMNNSFEAAEVLNQLDSLVEENDRFKSMFPLQTMQSMAERWGVKRQAVNNWAQRHNDFPKPIEGMVAVTAKTPTYYPLYEVERYEKVRGLVK